MRKAIIIEMKKRDVMEFQKGYEKWKGNWVMYKSVFTKVSTKVPTKGEKWSHVFQTDFLDYFHVIVTEHSFSN